jgi:hypothetical protein
MPRAPPSIWGVQPAGIELMAPCGVPTVVQPDPTPLSSRRTRRHPLPQDANAAFRPSAESAPTPRAPMSTTTHCHCVEERRTPTVTSRPRSRLAARTEQPRADILAPVPPEHEAAPLTPSAMPSNATSRTARHLDQQPQYRVCALPPFLGPHSPNTGTIPNT